MSENKDTRIDYFDVEFIEKYKSFLPMVKAIIVQDLPSLKKLNDLEKLLSVKDDFEMANVMRLASKDFLVEIGFTLGRHPSFSAAKFEGLMSAIQKAYKDQQNLSVEQLRGVYQDMKKTILAMDAEKQELEKNSTEILAATNNMLADAKGKLRFTAKQTKEKLKRVTETIQDIVNMRRSERDKPKVDMEKLQRVYWGNPEDYYGL